MYEPFTVSQIAKHGLCEIAYVYSIHKYTKTCLTLYKQVSPDAPIIPDYCRRWTVATACVGWGQVEVGCNEAVVGWSSAIGSGTALFEQS